MSTKPFDAGPGARPSIRDERMVYFDNSQSVITLHPFTVTLVTITAPVGFVGDRGAILPASMAAATDGANYCVGTAAIRPQASKSIEIITTMYSSAFADPKFIFGLGVVSTTGTANVFGGTDFTDCLLVTKNTGYNSLAFHARKASGTAESANVAFAGGDSTWLRFHLIMTRDANTAGKGVMSLYGGADSLDIVPLLQSWTVPTQFADTVSLAPIFGWLSGTKSGASQVGLSHGCFGWRVNA